MSSLTPAVLSAYSSKNAPVRPASAVSNRESKTNPKRNASSARTPSSAEDVTAAMREPIDLPRRRRVKSAVAAADNRVITLSADNTPWGSRVWGETSYKRDFPPKKTTQRSQPRPSSATRMNNPHPSKMFMQWRIPTRIHPHSRAVKVDPLFLRDIQEGFYQDYVADENKTGGAMYEVPITNVAKIPFPGNVVKAQSGLEVTGNKVTLAERQKELVAEPISTERILEETLQPTSYMAYQEWIHEASEDEKQILAKMLKAVRVEDSRVKRALSEVFTKESLKNIKEWMHGADQRELALAIKVVEQLSSRSQKYSNRSTMGHYQSKPFKGLARSRTWPKQKRHGEMELGIHGKMLRPHSAEKCTHCSSSDTESIYASLKSSPIKLRYSQVQPKTILWHHKVKPPQVPRLLNVGSVFGLPHKPRGQHFALHPEWPIA